MTLEFKNIQCDECKGELPFHRITCSLLIRSTTFNYESNNIAVGKTIKSLSGRPYEVLQIITSDRKLITSVSKLTYGMQIQVRDVNGFKRYLTETNFQSEVVKA